MGSSSNLEFAELVLAGLGLFPFAFYIGWGFAQAVFYLRRLAGPRRNDAFWWCSTLIYNIPVTGCAVSWFAAQPRLTSAAAALAAFVGLKLAFSAWVEAEESCTPCL